MIFGCFMFISQISPGCLIWLFYVTENNSRLFIEQQWLRLFDWFEYNGTDHNKQYRQHP